MKKLAASLVILLALAAFLSACSDPVSPDNNGRTRKGGPNRSGITWQ